MTLSSRRERVVTITSFVTDMSVHCVNCQFLALVHGNLPTTFYSLVLMVEDTGTASAALLFDLPDISVLDYVNLITHSFTEIKLCKNTIHNWA